MSERTSGSTSVAPGAVKTLREWRESVGDTQQEFAARLDVSISALAIWERGERIPLKRVQRHIAERLHVAPEQVVYSDANVKPHGKATAASAS